MKYEIETTNIFEKWLVGIKDAGNRARIISRLDHVRLGNFGDHKNLGGRLFELRFFFGPGFRVYYTVRTARLSFCFVEATNPARAKTLTKREPSWLNWSNYQ